MFIIRRGRVRLDFHLSYPAQKSCFQRRSWPVGKPFGKPKNLENCAKQTSLSPGYGWQQSMIGSVSNDILPSNSVWRNAGQGDVMATNNLEICSSSRRNRWVSSSKCEFMPR
jgi:hypothetical protein